MTRVLSALVLLPIVIGTIWFLPPVATLVLATLAAVLAFLEYARIAQALGARVPRALTGVAVAAACVATALPEAAVALVLATAMIVLGSLVVATGQPGAAVLRDVSASAFPLLYIGLPLGAFAAVRATGGREAVLLLMGTIIVSDTAQYYTGRALGRTPLAPAISPKKTREGALGGILFGTVAMALAGAFVFPWARVWMLALLGGTVVLLGIAGDLFESLLKRSAGVKDSSALIPGHGGILDRIDSWLFAAPVFYVFVLYAQA